MTKIYVRASRQGFYHLSHNGNSVARVRQLGQFARALAARALGVDRATIVFLHL